MRALTPTENVPYKEATPLHFRSLCATYGICERDFAPLRIACTLASGKVPKRAYARLLEMIAGMDERPYMICNRMPDVRRRDKALNATTASDFMKMKNDAKLSWGAIAQAIGLSQSCLRRRIARGDVPNEAVAAIQNQLQTQTQTQI